MTKGHYVGVVAINYSIYILKNLREKKISC